MIAGLDGSAFRAGMVTALVLLAIHLPLLAAALWGLWALGKGKRRGHLFYVVPITWYFFGLVVYGVCGSWYPEFARRGDWPLGQHPEAESLYLGILLSSLLLPAHGTVLTRLLHRPGEPAVSLLALWSIAGLAVLPPAGLAGGLVALRRIQREPARLSGKAVAWAAIILNGLVCLWLLLWLGDYLMESWRRLEVSRRYAAAEVFVSHSSVD
jgi:hypothetical protein